MSTIYLTRKGHFAAAHRLHNPELSDEENLRIYGPCNNPNWHGHNYNLEVTIAGEPDPRTGMLCNLKDLDRVIRQTIIDQVDHKNLNLEVAFLDGVTTTVENLVLRFWQVLADQIPAGRLHEIRLYETERNVAIYRGE